MAENVEVRLGADASPAKAGMQDASSSIQASLAGIQKSLETFTTTNRRMRDEAIKNNADLSRTFFELRASAEGGFNGIIGVIQRFRGVWVSLAGILAGGYLWKSSVEEMIHFEEQVRKLEIVFGMLSDQATTTAVALKIMGKTGDDFAAMGMKLARQIKQDEHGLNALGIVTRDTATNGLLPLDQIMQNAFVTMQDYRAGADQDVVALKAFGRSVGDVVDVMLKMPAAQARAIQLQRELGIEMGPERQKQIEAYKLEMGAFQVVIASVGERIGEAAMPQLMNLAKYFNEVGPGAAEVIIKAVKLVIATIDALATGAKETYLFVKAVWDNLVIAAVSTWRAIKAAATLEWDEIPAIVEAANKRILRNTLETNAAILGLEADLVKRLGAMDEDRKTPERPGAGPMRSGTKTVPVSGTVSGTDLIAEWRHQLDLMRDAEDAFHEVSKATEAAFWASKLELAKKGGEKVYNEVFHLMVEARKGAAREEFAIQMASYGEQLAAAKNNRDQQLEIVAARTEFVKSKYGEESKEFKLAMTEMIRVREAWAAKDQQIVAITTKMAETRADFDAKMELMAGQQKVALRQANNQQLFALEQQLEDRTYAIKRDGLARKLEAEKAGPDDPVKVAEINAQIEALEEQHQERLTTIANDAERDRMAFMIQMEDAFQNTFATMLDDLMSRTKSWKDVMLDAVKSITSALNKLVAENIAKQLFGAGSAGGGLLSSIFGSLFGGGGMPTFDVGTPYVPRDTMALVHRGEAIIPASQNKGRPGGGALSVTNNFHISGPVDSRTQDQIAASAARATQRAMYRNL